MSKQKKGVMTKLHMLTGVSVAGLLIFGIVAFKTLNTVKVNGSYYEQIIENKDLLADVLPPPNYIVESYLITHLMPDASADELPGLIEQFNKLKKDYADRQAYWQNKLSEGDLKSDMNLASREPAEAFFAIVDQELIPALKKSDREAADASLSKLHPLYEAHREVVNRIVTRASENTAAVEADTASTISFVSWMQCLVGFAAITTIIGLNLWMRRSVIEQQAKDIDNDAKLASISKAQAVIEFTMDGTIVAANENFLRTTGYSLDEITGKHHAMFVRESYSKSPEYRDLWQRLNKGENVLGEFERVKKNGEELWLQASYNPIPDCSGKFVKVVKYASDITGAVLARRAMADVMRMINDNASILGAAAEELTAVSSEMAANAEETSSQANVVSAASEQVSKNVLTVSTGVDEMNSAIREIAKNASEAARVAQQAVSTAEEANTSITKLGESSIEIGNVIKVITSIAEQTNLLALNATIEAARAGEAGKGFAVVANEVKELAKDTARATEDISRKIETIQTDTNGAITSIQQIGQVIAMINDISTTIAGAVEEQTATANEMGRNVSEAAKGTAEIAENITAVAQAAQSTTQGANNSQQAASELSRMASELQRLGSQQNDHSLAV